MSDHDPKSPPPDESLLEELVARCVTAFEQDGSAGLDRVCQDHPDQEQRLRERVAWLAERGLVGADRDPAPAGAAATVPEQIGPYRVLGVLGQGGMGTVYVAEQRAPVRRRVALKVIKLGMDSAMVLRRFEAERQALAMMSHDGIAKVFDAGTTERGQPYFVMELITGMPITEYCDRQRLNTRERLQLFKQVCAAVEHAHQKGVIHRDLKPTNILVTAQETPVAKVIDFGVARATDHRLTEATLFTEQGRILGTPEYMSPEQAEMSSQDIDTRTDIYSLGVILYELLVGELPFPSAELRRAGLLEIQRVIRESEPPRPSTKVSTIGVDSEHLASMRRTSPTALRRDLRGDLDWIVLMAMDKNRGRRYGTATALAEDIERHLAHEPVVASPPSASYRLRKFGRRYRGQVVAGTLIFAVLAAGIVSFALENRRANRALQTAESALQNYDLLANVVNLRDAKAAEQELYPAWPAHADAMRRWLAERAEPLADELPTARLTRDVLREKAVPSSVDEVSAQEAGMTAEAVLQFEDPGSRFLHDALADLVEGLEAFVDPESGELAGVRERLRWAERVEDRSIAAQQDRWDAARAALRAADGTVASELYASDPPLDLRPQTGLVPIGMNPVTGLWEFYHLRSAADPDVIPKHDAAGAIPIAEKTGIVFVLVPGGTLMMGAQPDDPSGQNYDPHAQENETLHEETVQPYFLARHEVTQAQWRRLSRGETPSGYRHPFQGRGMRLKITDEHPVERVSWQACHELMMRHGLELPTEAEWEYACRAGTSTPWFTGDRRELLSGHANVLDATGDTSGAAWGTPEAFDDGFVVHAPVGSFAANSFGMFDMHGNVWEWCHDVLPTAPGDRVMRGGGFSSPATSTRSADREGSSPTFQGPIVGLRAARPVLD